MTELLVDIAGQFDVEIDIRYAGDNNFTGAPVYTRPGCYLNPEAAGLLERAVALARPLGFRFRVFDAFRPTEAAWALWHHTPDPEFLADPRRGSPHSRGAAVDLTLVDGDGRPLDMATDFDAFLPQAHHARTDIPVDAQRNRALLLGIMTAAGWDNYRNEWWHYQLFEPRRFPLLSDSAAGTRMMDSAGRAA
ncbi:D-alanyl-D-alanine dipeptidase [Oceanibacterium hippocampi]|uniref:D-alanyl-D-alanine dipeptidase n=1 Tax=Oceanibacterium hippocampi TaxID=745714 RepID=A0A1Y5RKB0_9PROT|nr:D-alanyl-D-alanine dipeptidase [Oceanibacterium hippocampi]SLN19528.1 D-alanyl-D-alanine dipeptidase [Oceanibacterium hippocampi]